MDIQGLIALEKDANSKALYVSWMVAAPQNNKEITDDVKNVGVGGHLFSIAADKSFEYGYEGFLYGFAANEKLLWHYSKVFGAIHVGILHPYHFMIDTVSAKKLERYMIMIGQMQRYKESLSETPGPILMKDMPSISIDYRGLSAYAKDKGIEPAALSKREKDSFCKAK